MHSGEGGAGFFVMVCKALIMGSVNYLPPRVGRYPPTQLRSPGCPDWSPAWTPSQPEMPVAWHSLRRPAELPLASMLHELRHRGSQSCDCTTGGAGF